FSPWARTRYAGGRGNATGRVSDAVKQALPQQSAALPRNFENVMHTNRHAEAGVYNRAPCGALVGVAEPAARCSRGGRERRRFPPQASVWTGQETAQNHFAGPSRNADPTRRLIEGDA